MIKDDALLEAAKTAAFRLLAHRGRSVQELADRLRRKEFPEEVIAEVVHRLKELNLLDDAAVARQWARSYAVNSLWGDRKIRHRLREMGISEDLVSEALAEARQELPEPIAIGKILKKRSPERLTAQANSAKEEQRLIRHLAAKGFAPPAIFQVLANPVEEDDSFDGQ